MKRLEEAHNPPLISKADSRTGRLKKNKIALQHLTEKDRLGMLFKSIE